MAEPVLKFPPDPKGNPPEKGPSATSSRRTLMGALRHHRRSLLLVVLPLIALVGGVAFYLTGGRYVTTDDAYVGAQKVLITPDISGKVENIVVREGQHVNAGDILFEIDPVPFRFAVQQAKATLDTARTSYDNLVSNVRIYGQMADLGQQGVELKQRDVERKSSLVKSNAGSQLDLDNSATSLVTARAQLEFVKQQISNAKNQLLDNIQLGRFVAAGTPILSVIDDAKPWVDANPKESDFTYVAVGQSVTIDIDAFPDHVFKGTVSSLSPGTGAQFAILPPQNATGNFVKVVQRVPLRVTLDADDKMVRKLKAGMSSYVSIDTGHRRSLAAMLGLAPAAAAQD
jgi:membrane fusion protein (multidrug efflux system)